MEAIQLSQRLPDMGLFMEQGTGKTRVAIEILRRLYASRGVMRKTLIIAPVIVCPNWKHEILMYSKIKERDIVVLQGAGTKRAKVFLKEVGETLAGSKIVITNYEALEMDLLYDLFKAWRPEIVICDESQRLKGHNGKRSKRLVHITDNSKHNYILTGTPVLDGKGMDLYMQFRIMDRGETFGRNYFAFREKYFYDENAAFKSKQSYYPKWVPRPTMYEDLQRRVHHKSVRVLKKDCLDLPPLVRQELVVNLSAEQVRAYKEMYRDYVTWIESKAGEPKAAVAQLAVTKVLRLQQIVTGFVKDEDGEVHRFKDVPRLKVLRSQLEALLEQHKVIVWSHFRENQQMITEMLQDMGVGYAEIHGEIKDKQEQMDRFRTDPGVRVMVANQGAGGVGVNLVEASYSIYYSKGPKLEDDLQSEARNYRGGSDIHEKVTRIDLVSPGTIDEIINENLMRKQNVADKILDLKERLKYEG